MTVVVIVSEPFSLARSACTLCCGHRLVLLFEFRVHTMLAI